MIDGPRCSRSELKVKYHSESPISCYLSADGELSTSEQKCDLLELHEYSETLVQISPYFVELMDHINAIA